MTEIFSILFWTDEQKKLIDSFHKEESVVLLGDYGTGKTVVIQSVAEKLRNSDRDLVYINALDTETYSKTWEDVLDVIAKLRFGSGVTVEDIGAMRKKYEEETNNPRETISTSELIDDYISNLKNAKNTVVGVMKATFNILISIYFRLSVTSFIYLEMTGARLAKVRSLR